MNEFEGVKRRAKPLLLNGKTTVQEISPSRNVQARREMSFLRACLRKSQLLDFFFEGLLSLEYAVISDLLELAL